MPDCISMFISAEERKIVKVSYQESLQNVPTVRQQAAVSHLHSCHIISFVPLQDGAPHTVCSTFAASVGEKDELKHWVLSPKGAAKHSKDRQSYPLRCPPFSPGTAAISAPKKKKIQWRTSEWTLAARLQERRVSNLLIFVSVSRCAPGRNKKARRGLGASESTSSALHAFPVLLGNDGSYRLCRSPLSVSCILLGEKAPHVVLFFKTMAFAPCF